MMISEYDRNFNVAFSAFLRQGRESKGLSQAEMAEKLGVSQSLYSYIENGQRTLNFSTATMLCDMLNPDITEFSRNYKG